MLQCAYDKLKSMESQMTLSSTDDDEELITLRHENNALKSGKVSLFIVKTVMVILP